MTVKFRCEEHQWEWFADHAGCPRCLKRQRDELAKALEKIAYDPFGKSDATDREVLDAITEYARRMLQKEGMPRHA